MAPDNFGPHQQQQNSPSAFPFFQPHFPAQMRNLPNGMSPNQQQILFPVTDAQQHQQINGIRSRSHLAINSILYSYYYFSSHPNGCCRATKFLDATNISNANAIRTIS
jgi:hypothetical protein